MLEQYKKIFDMLNSHEKRMFLVLVGVMVLAAFSEILGLSVFMALLSVLAQPELIEGSDFLSRAYTILGLESLMAFQLVLSLAAAAVIALGLIIKAGVTYLCLLYTSDAADE